MRTCWNHRSRANREDGIAMIVTLMVLVLVSALMVGFVTAIVADQRASGLDRDQTQAYAAAHAGLEQLTANLSGLFATDFSPTSAEINDLTATPPELPNFTFVEPGGGSGYRINFTPNAQGNPAPESTTGTTISAGPYQGLRGVITPYNITVTARTRGGAEVRMRRTLQTVAMPVFQFGQFSESDLGFHAEQDFEFGGRVHTNGTLYLSQGGSNSTRLTLSDRITAVN
jgi:Tfp pilus assembly protein PilX